MDRTVQRSHKYRIFVGKTPGKEHCEKRQEVGKIPRYAYKSLARPTSRCILFDGENSSFDASLVIYVNSTNIPPIMISSIYKHQNLLSL